MLIAVWYVTIKKKRKRLRDVRGGGYKLNNMMTKIRSIYRMKSFNVGFSSITKALKD